MSWLLSITACSIFTRMCGRLTLTELKKLWWKLVAWAAQLWEKFISLFAK